MNYNKKVLQVETYKLAITLANRAYEADVPNPIRLMCNLLQSAWDMASEKHFPPEKVFEELKADMQVILKNYSKVDIQRMYSNMKAASQNGNNS